LGNKKRSSYIDDKVDIKGKEKYYQDILSTAGHLKTSVRGRYLILGFLCDNILQGGQYGRPGPFSR
jgi:hypothetical protein